jgi:hypothetical protein
MNNCPRSIIEWGFSFKNIWGCWQKSIYQLLLRLPRHLYCGGCLWYSSSVVPPSCGVILPIRHVSRTCMSGTLHQNIFSCPYVCVGIHLLLCNRYTNIIFAKWKYNMHTTNGHHNTIQMPIKREILKQYHFVRHFKIFHLPIP